ncbi:V-type ATP synthase subunit D [Thiocystis violacea]|uniref:V-type ATP synthase subunit D n=1 Tax=Thiocystis violacea TaxID=13725 RepID=UPI0019030103|nr:V-type ATP synthase subunit D [Thiocystis violacea]MBK1717879.1 ATPase [Thiocystis violacea]
MSDNAIVPTQSALLELKEERIGLREGYRFLDEKRLILAAEILAEIADYEREKVLFDADQAKAAEALQAAVVRHGFEGLSLYPPVQDLDVRIELKPRVVLGVTLHEASLTGEAPIPPAVSVAASPEADACRAAFIGLVPRAARLAARVANLERLRVDYARAARRARALEDVLLPETEERINGIETVLEELEREEAIRARLGGDRDQPSIPEGGDRTSILRDAPDLPRGKSERL